MAEPLEYIAVAEALTFGAEALEGLGVIGAAAEAGAGGLALETAGAGALTLETASAGAGSLVALDAIGTTGLVATETIVGSEAAGLGAAALEVATDAAIPTVVASEGLTTAGVVGVEVSEGSSLLETAGSLASKIPSAGTVGKTVVGGYATGDIASRLMSGDDVGEALVGTAGDLAKILAKGTGYTIEELLKNIDPSILVLAGVGAYFYLIR